MQACTSTREPTPTYTYVYEGSNFTEVWQKISAEPYAVEDRPTRGLPDLVKEVVARGFAQTGKTPNATSARNAELVARANQTLNDQADYYEDSFTKLVHANGICLKGSWNITNPNPYSGYFEQGKSGLMIARASVALFDIEKHQNRGFGLAGKIYPASNETNAGTRNLETANFFTIHDLGGERNVLFTDVSFTNQPPITFNLKLLHYLGYGWQIMKAFGNADANNGNADPAPGVRQLYEISELGLNEDQALKTITPRCLRVMAQPGQSNDKSDFRDELNLAGYPDSKLLLDIYADSPESDTACGELSDGAWIGKKIGYIEFTESVASKGCDSHLHFHHPKWKDVRHAP
jgi:hypothetical protein